MSISLDDLTQSDMLRLVEAGPLHTAQEVADFLAAEEGERGLIVESYRSAGIAVSVTSWDDFIRVMGAIAVIAGAVVGVTSVINGVYGVAKL